MKYIDAEKLVDKIWEICDYASEHWDVEEERGAYNFAKRLTEYGVSISDDKAQLLYRSLRNAFVDSDSKQEVEPTKTEE